METLGNELISRYVTAIGKHLPKKSRADIENEIRSTLEDILADRSEKTGRPVDEAMVKEVLKSYGAPEKVAATYMPERYLIGPRMYPLFWLVLRIVFSVLTVLAIIGLGIRIGMSPDTEAIASTIGNALLQYINGLIIALGNIVLIFAILERVLPASEIKSLNPSDGSEWDPQQLMSEPTGDEVRMWEPVIGILFTFAALAVFNFYPQIISFFPIQAGGPRTIPLLSDAFFRYLPWLNLLWVLEIVHQLALLRLGRRTPLTRWFAIALKVGGIALAAAMLTGPSLVGLTAGALTAENIEPGAANVLVLMLSQMVRAALIIAIIASTVDIFKEAYRLLTGPARVRPVVTQK